MDSEQQLSMRFRTDYRIVRPLGRGGSGEVLEAIQVNLNRKVAIKLLRTELYADDESRRRLIEEARVLAKLSHRAIVTLLGASIDGDCPYLVMEYVDGPTLAQLLRVTGPLPVPRALELMLEVASGLAYLHGASIVHRDLKPENVLMRDGSQPKIADFGLARGPDTVRLTEQGFAVGTPMYMAPELLVGGAASPQSDVYAFGMTLYHVLTSRFPVLPGARDAQVAEKLSLTRPILETKMAGMPPVLAAFLVKCLAYAPADRYAGAKEAEAALRLARATLVDSSGQMRVREQEPGRGNAPAHAAAPGLLWRRRAGMLASSGALAVALAAATLLWLRGVGPSETSLPARLPTLAGTADPTGRAPAAVRGASSPAQLPRTCTVTLGTDRIRLVFPAPLGGPARFEYREPAGRSVIRKELPAGRADHLLTGLRPATRYRAGVLSGGATLPLTFTTLNSASRVEDALTKVSAIFDQELAGSRNERELQGVQLDTGDTLTVDADVAVRGPRLAALWRRYRHGVEGTLRFRESRDGGLTWGPAVRFSGPERVTSAPRLVWTSGGLLATWTSEAATGTRSFFKFRREGSESWEPVVAVPSRRPGATLLERPDGTLDLLLAPPDPARSLFTLSKLQFPFSGPPSSIPAFNRADARFSHLLRTPAGLVAVCCDADDLNPEHRVWCSLPSDGGRWTPPRPLTDPGERPQQFTAATAGNIVVGAYRVDSEIRLRVSTDGGHEFGPIRRPMPSDWMASLPALAARGDDLYLGCLNYGVSGGLGRKGLALMHTRNGLDWTMLSQWPMWLFDPRCLRLVAGKRELVAVTADTVRGVLLFQIPLAPGG